MTVYAAELLGLDGDHAAFRVRVSTGTYIRALARDLGERLGVGAHLDELRREAIGGLRVEDAVPLADVGPGTPLVPLTRVLEHLPAVALDEVQRPDPKAIEPQRVAAIAQPLAPAFGNELIEQLAAEAKRRVGVTINKKLVDQLRAELTGNAPVAE